MTTPDAFRPPLSSDERLDMALEPTNSNLGLKDYLFFGNIELNDLRGTVLDIGSGDLDRFAREAAQEGVTVVSIDPFLVTGEQRYQVREGVHLEFRWISLLPWQQRSIAGIAQELPIRSGSIDTVVSSSAMPGYIDPADYPTALGEVKRVLKPGGKALLFPLLEVPGTLYNHQVFLAALDQCGMSYILKHIDVNSSGMGKPYDVATLEKVNP